MSEVADEVLFVIAIQKVAAEAKITQVSVTTKQLASDLLLNCLKI